MEYLTIKSLHIISVVSWMAGLFYLPRLFVYHVSAKHGSELSETFKIMERRLFRYIMGPAMIATWIFGIWLIALAPELISEIWLILKLVAVAFLTGFHHMLGRWRLAFAKDCNIKLERFYRIINELPTVALIIIVFLVILKPF
ncbi:MAG: protoporphyrinogen oxidase HemJ [Rhodospirillaceae bacterium]